MILSDIFIVVAGLIPITFFVLEILKESKR